MKASIEREKQAAIVEKILAQKLKKYEPTIYQTAYGYCARFPKQSDSVLEKLKQKISAIEDVGLVRVVPGEKVSQLQVSTVDLENFLPEDELEEHCSSNMGTLSGLLPALKKRPSDQFLGPRLAKNLSECGQVLYKKRIFSAARLCYTVAVLYNDGDGLAHFHLGKIFQTQMRPDYDKAEYHFQRFVENYPQKAIGYLRLGEVLLENSRASQAVRYLKKYITMNPRDVRGHTGFGIAKLKLGAIDHAKDHLLHALRLDNDYKPIYIPLAQAYETLHNIPRAKIILKNYLQREKRDYRTYEMMGRFYRMSEEYKKAKRYFKRSLKMNPDNIIAYRLLAEVYEELGEMEKARVLRKKHDAWKSILDEYGVLKVIGREGPLPEPDLEDTAFLEIEEIPEIEEIE